VIDERYQHLGHGRAALLAVVEQAREARPAALALGLSYAPGNLAAAHLYRSLGFVAEPAPNAEGEVVAWLPLAPRAPHVSPV
jgi:ribosomal protein S18 acetylase RimI-like enzyme